RAASSGRRTATRPVRASGGGPELAAYREVLQVTCRLGGNPDGGFRAFLAPSAPGTPDAAQVCMTSQHHPIVVGFDFGASSSAALDQAIAAAHAPEHVLHIACIVEPHHPLPAVPGGPVDYAYTERVRAQLATEVANRLAAADRSGVHV